MSAEDYPYNFDDPQRSETCQYDEKKATSCQVSEYHFGCSKGKCCDVPLIKSAVSKAPIAAAMNAK